MAVKAGGDDTFGTRLRKRRVELGLSQGSLGARIYRDRSAIAHYEAGRKLPSISVAAALDVSLGTGDELRTLVVDEQSVKPTGTIRRVQQLPPAPGSRFGGRPEAVRLRTEMMGVFPGPLVLTGPAGVGKSSMALTWAHAIEDQYPHGVLYASLHGPTGDPVGPGEVLHDWLSALEQPVPRSSTAREHLLRTTVSQRRMLMVLDDAHDSDQVRSLLPGTKECFVLVTSRHRLSGLAVRDAARHVNVRPLDEDTSTELLASRLEVQIDGADMPALRALAIWCDGLPLALHSVAEHLNAQPDQTGRLRRLAASLADRPPRTSVTGSVSGVEWTCLRSAYQRSLRCVSTAAARLLSTIAASGELTVSVGRISELSRCSDDQSEALAGELTGENLLTEVRHNQYSCSPVVADVVQYMQNPTSFAENGLWLRSVPA